jgi:hypothetical protein
MYPDSSFQKGLTVRQPPEFFRCRIYFASSQEETGTDFTLVQPEIWPWTIRPSRLARHRFL